MIYRTIVTAARSLEIGLDSILVASTTNTGRTTGRTLLAAVTASRHSTNRTTLTMTRRGGRDGTSAELVTPDVTTKLSVTTKIMIAIKVIAGVRSQLATAPIHRPTLILRSRRHLRRHRLLSTHRLMAGEAASDTRTGSVRGKSCCRPAM